MPIRFRCAHCDKLLGIARRKAGSIVNCPQCGQPLIVPTPEEEVADEALASASSTRRTEMPADGTGRGDGTAKLFEDDEIDRLLDSSPDLQPRPAGGNHPLPATVPAPSRAIVPQARPSANGLPVPLPMPVPAALPISVPSAGGIPVGKIVVLILIVFALVTGAFVAGLFVGKGMK